MTDLTELREEASAGVNRNLRLAHYGLEAADEIDRLRHDIARHLDITTSQQAEIEGLRDLLRELYAWHGVSSPMPPSLRNRILAVFTVEQDADRDLLKTFQSDGIVK